MMPHFGLLFDLLVAPITPLSIDSINIQEDRQSLAPWSDRPSLLFVLPFELVLTMYLCGFPQVLRNRKASPPLTTCPLPCR
ncbi:uncharacterized protein LY89DRAFT_144256 [Mollisia scopiformis]|uniref:Uncharacterized protein n=1 Tax=Mollisia scopiformis TaxID=149040 RepID=A0A194X0C8_MOLSC|nr:uncharacterized protein LY89DRAFT_144256 [Mollisia scopiformis]KUJ13650.1 hypothetical protein LY89DRAFT_144256 [Mollisia scopiformis]